MLHHKHKTTYSLNAKNIYKSVLSGDLKRFPNGFWMEEDSSQNAIECTKYLIEDILNWHTDEDILNNLKASTFKKNKLAGMLLYIYGDSPFRAIDAAYPNRFTPWNFKMCPLNFWTFENARIACDWLFNEKLKWNDNDIKNNLCNSIFYENNLGGMLDCLFSKSTYKVVEFYFPGKFKPWELKKTPQNFWTNDTSIEATRWLIEEKLKWNHDDIKNKLCINTFSKHGLMGMLRHYNSSCYAALNSLYPNTFKPWELKKVPNSYWKKDTAREAIIWLIEEKLCWSDDKIKESISTKIFQEYNLRGMLSIVFNDSVFDALDFVYPNRFEKSEIKSYRIANKI